MHNVQNKCIALAWLIICKLSHIVLDVVNEDLEGPYYTHLGTARSIQAAREIMEKR